MSIYTDSLSAMSENQLREECHAAYTCWLDMTQRERDKLHHRADFCLMECRARGLVETLWKPVVEEVRAALRERRNSQ